MLHTGLGGKWSSGMYTEIDAIIEDLHRWKPRKQIHSTTATTQQ
jgi:hypothetical protein